jgi:hypothetical protein
VREREIVWCQQVLCVWVFNLRLLFFYCSTSPRQKEGPYIHALRTHTTHTNTRSRTLSNPAVQDSGATCLDITKAWHLCIFTSVRVWTRTSSRMIHTTHIHTCNAGMRLQTHTHSKHA